MMEIERPKIETASLSPDGRYGRFVAEPLERGFGITLGNSLRRVLLSSLPGVAVTSVKIDGVVHEFSTIEGVKEDVTEIVLNLKGIAAKLYTDGPKTVRVEAVGPCEVTADNIKQGDDIEILNPEWHIATLGEGGKLVGSENITYETCKHPNTSTVTVEATCTEDGSVTVVCDDCGAELSVEKLPAKGHTEEVRNAKEATCTEDGYTGDTYCSVCGELLEKGEVIPAHCASAAYTDLDTDSWYHPYTDYVIDNGLMGGVGNAQFDPDGVMTRAMLVTVLYRMAGSPAVDGKTSFTDVPADAYYADAVAWAKEQGIALGVTATTFAPEKAVTREEAATFLYRYVTATSGKPEAGDGDLSVFRDADKVQEYAKEAMTWAVGESLFGGFPNGTLQPAVGLTRAQMAKLLTLLDQNF